MAQNTINLNLVKPEIEDNIESTISALASNFEKIDGDLNSHGVQLADIPTKEEIGDPQNLQTNDKSTLVAAINEIKKRSEIEVLTTDPSELYEGRIWVIADGKLIEMVEVDNLNAVDSVTGYGINNDGTRKASNIYTPPSTIAISKIETKLTSRNSTAHNTGNNITVKLCRDNGSGIPDEANPIATATITGCPATPDTEFTGVAVFASSSNNYVNAPILNAGERYHFVLSTSGSGLSYYSTKVSGNASATDRLASSYFFNTWNAISEVTNPNYRIFKVE